MARSFLGRNGTIVRYHNPPHRTDCRKVRFGLRPQLESLERRDLLASYTTLEDTPLAVTDASLADAVIVTPPDHGKVALAATGGFVYSPNLNYNGPDRFIYSTGPTNGTPPTTGTEISITVTPVNDPPEAHGDQYLAQQDTTLTIDSPGVLKNDTDIDSPSLTAVLVSQASHGQVALKDGGGFTYVPVSGYTGPDTFTYSANDGQASSNPATVSLYVASNTVIARDNTYLALQNAVLNIAAPGVFGNDTGINGRPLAASLEPNSGPQHGTLTLNSDGSFCYTPATDYVGPDSFVYRATDVSPLANPLPPASATAKVTIYVRSTAPIVVANNDIYFTQQNTALSIAPPGVLKNDFVVSPDSNAAGTGSPLSIPLSTKLVTDVTHGTLTLNADGSFNFTPERDFVGAATFTYQAVMNPPPGAADPAPNPNSHDTATVTIYVKPPIPAPIANNDYYSVLQDTTLSIAAPGVLKNDAPVSNYPLASMLDHGPANGTLTLNADGSFTYTPNAGYTGGDSFTYFDTETYVPPTTDGGPVPDPILIHGNTATVYINVLPLHPPVYAFDDYYKTLPGTTLTIATPGVLANDTIFPPPLPLMPDGDASTAASTSNNTGPSPTPIPYPNVTLTAKLLTDVSNGKLTFNSDGSFTYTPNGDFSGADTFTYQATATANGTAPPGTTAISTDSTTDLSFPCTIDGPCPTPPDDIATVTIYVKAPEPPPGPVAINDYFITAENTSLGINAPGVLRNDYVRGFVPTPGAANATNQPPTFPLTAVLVAGPSNGTLTLNPDGSFKYEPSADFVGIDTFTYQDTLATTGTDATTPLVSNIATVTIKVVPAIAHGDQYQTPQDTTLNVPKPGVLANDSGGSAAHPLVATQLSGPLHGNLTLNPDGSFQYIPAAGYSGPDVFTYRASDGTTPPPTAIPADATALDDPNNGMPTNAIDVGIVRIYVRPVVSGIQAHDDKFPAIVNTTLDIPAPGVLGNDFGPVNVPVVSTLVTDVQNGKLTLNSDGSFSYTPNTDFTGEDHFTYSAAPADPTSPIKGSTATVTIYVLAANAIPRVIIGDNQTTTDESGPQNVADFATVCSVNDDGQPDTYTVTTDNPKLFTAPPTIDATGQLTYTPAPNVSGDATITVVTHDDSGDATQTFTIHVDKPHPLYNAANPYDVNNDKFVAPNDVVALINYLNSNGNPSVEVAEGEGDGLPYYDVSRDNFIAPNDALMIINAINAGLAGGNGEAAPSDAIDNGLLTLVAQDTAEATMGHKRSG
jgi:hypothetical protein